MMRREPQKQPSLFYTRFNLDHRISSNHPLRSIDQIIDFKFIYDEVCEIYGHNGNVSVPPAGDSQNDAAVGDVQRALRT